MSATSRMLDFQSDAVGTYEATGGRMVSSVCYFELKDEFSFSIDFAE